MPNGFPNFRHDPNTEPRYVIKTTKTSSQSQPRYTDSISQPTAGPKLSKYQYPTERGKARWSLDTQYLNLTVDRAQA